MHANCRRACRCVRASLTGRFSGRAIDRRRFRDLGQGFFFLDRHPTWTEAPVAAALADRRSGGCRRRCVRCRCAGQVTGISLLIFHCCPSLTAVTTHLLPLTTGFFGSPPVLVIFVATSTLTLPSSCHFSIPASSTAPVVGSACATRIRIEFCFSLYSFAKSPVACLRTRSA